MIVLVGDGWNEARVLVHVVLDNLQPAVGQPGPELTLHSVRITLFGLLCVLRTNTVKPFWPSTMNGPTLNYKN